MLIMSILIIRNVHDSSPFDIHKSEGEKEIFQKRLGMYMKAVHLI